MEEEGFDISVWVLALYRSLTLFKAVLVRGLATCTVGLVLYLSQANGPHGSKVPKLSID